jgi:hypothetical protein
MIIDTHTHFLDCTCLCPCEDGLPIETMVQTQDKFGIKEMWISSTGALAQDFEFYNKNMFEHTKEYADRFRNFATASPYFEQRAIDNIRKCIEQYGFKGIKVHHCSCRYRNEGRHTWGREYLLELKDSLYGARQASMAFHAR